MSCSTSMSVSCGSGGDAYWSAPFTALQWQELEHQALIYKYLVAGVPVPSHLVLPIRRSFEALSARFLHHPTLGYYGKKFDPEPGRCKRTDGKKWRCSKDAYHESRYCEHHMHRGRNRSRKPVESQSLSTATSQVNTMNSGKGSCQNVTSARYTVMDSGGFDFGSNVSKLQGGAGGYVISDKDVRYSQGLTVNVDGQKFPSVGNKRDLSLDSNVDSSWGLMPSQFPTNSLLKTQNDSYLQTNFLQLNMSNDIEPILDATSMSKQRQQHCFFGSEIGSQESWSDLDATTQLSISMDPDFNARNASSPNDA